MSTKEDMNACVAKWDLLQHPFYQAWSAGTLPVEALRLYAREYGTFIHLLPRAWMALGDAETAQEEHEHAELWNAFAAALDTRVDGTPAVAEVKELDSAALRLFGDPATAAGALYAFEVQQPATAQSKLDGLKEHYRLPAAVEPYFEIHSHNQAEAAKLVARIDSFAAAQQNRSIEACGEAAELLWNALSGIYGGDCQPS